MALIHDIADQALAGLTREEISQQALVDRQVLDWLMDSDAFQMILEGRRGLAEEQGGEDS